jgi:hypothetical protein
LNNALQIYLLETVKIQKRALPSHIQIQAICIGLLIPLYSTGLLNSVIRKWKPTLPGVISETEQWSDILILT